MEIKQTRHTHTTFSGRKTGLDIKKTSDPDLHWHEVTCTSDKTSTGPYGENHTHVFYGDKTSEQILLIK